MQGSGWLRRSQLKSAAWDQNHVGANSLDLRMQHFHIQRTQWGFVYRSHTPPPS